MVYPVDSNIKEVDHLVVHILDVKRTQRNENKLLLQVPNHLDDNVV